MRVNILGGNLTLIVHLGRIHVSVNIGHLLLNSFLTFDRVERLLHLYWMLNTWWNCSACVIWVIMGIVHDVRVWVCFQLGLVTIFVVVWNCRVLKDQCAIWSNKWLVCLKFTPESIAT